ncbi:hypothetical protein COCCADRAFT_37212 [Bipolaris zeicola 26-R-13]|uniref:Arrestin-like N-terminal domain-containing protein n=1 Tax=Cochliobolus carbonum (strain 26-R-13) TaxID=930089 RepID=W6Y5K8_COCC2|nr:uncharacterized protein COCCADRAFT_37212 [Bipolaris zeicola 26-R-13]EUC32940.1 hypothetical protein COCCADRAFT_37212 [Bipolaris zeicola 26-R-13]
MTAPALRVTVDGDNNKIYQAGEKVKGQVWLAVEEQKEVASLKLVFAGSCITKTTRPLHTHGNNDATPSRQTYEEKIRLFNREKHLLSHCRLGPKKYSWDFEFIFPASTEPQYKRSTHGDNYLWEPHPLPPTFHLKTNVPDGTAQISYFVQARLILFGSTETKRCKQTLRYHPKPPAHSISRSRSTSSVLYGQSWKPTREKDESRVKKVFSGVSMNSTPRIVPTLYHPICVGPGGHIPLSLNLLNARDPANHAERHCTISTLSVVISTHSTTMCGNSSSYPEDTVAKHVTCISRSDMQTQIPFNKTVALTSNSFRLLDDAECIPSFKTYTITRRYTLGVTVGIQYNDQHFTVTSTTPLEILPRLRRHASTLPPAQDEEEDVEPLPVYSPREPPDREFAPDYEDIFNSLSRTPSSPESLLSRVESSSSSLFSRGSGVSTVASTPGVEVEHMRFERIV